MKIFHCCSSHTSFPAGESIHFTMTATNSRGKSVSREYKFVIENDGVSSLPTETWSREEFKEAMILGLVDPALMYKVIRTAQTG